MFDVVAHTAGLPQLVYRLSWSGPSAGLPDQLPDNRGGTTRTSMDSPSYSTLPELGASLADHFSSIRPNRQTANAMSHAATNRATMA